MLIRLVIDTVGVDLYLLMWVVMLILVCIDVD